MRVGYSSRRCLPTERFGPRSQVSVEFRDSDRTVYHACLTDGVASVVQKQREISIDVPNDGEYGKCRVRLWQAGGYGPLEFKPIRAKETRARRRGLVWARPRPVWFQMEVPL